jgi:hypothetical protein
VIWSASFDVPLGVELYELFLFVFQVRKSQT